LGGAGASDGEPEHGEHFERSDGSGFVVHLGPTGADHAWTSGVLLRSNWHSVTARSDTIAWTSRLGNVTVTVLPFDLCRSRHQTALVRVNSARRHPSYRKDESRQLCIHFATLRLVGNVGFLAYRGRQSVLVRPITSMTRHRRARRAAQDFAQVQVLRTGA
jgi:hypothetical protein